MSGGLIRTFAAILSPSERLRSLYLSEDEAKRLSNTQDVLSVLHIAKRWRMK